VLTAVVAALTMAMGAAGASASNRTWSWGNNDWGQLGDGISTVIEGSEATVFPAGVCALGTEGQCPSGPYLDEVTAISAGGAHSLALLSNGTVVAWGENESGQLGDGTHTGPASCERKGRVETERIETRPCSATPVAVSGLDEVTAISAGGAHSLALFSNGTVVAWGNNGKGQLGDGTTENSDAAIAVSGLHEVTAISAGGAHSLALLRNGTVMAWGDNESGQLGDGTTKNRHVPIAVSGLTGVTGISAATSGAHSLAVLSYGTVMAWGANNEGQLGDGSLESSNVPVAVSGLTGAAAVSGGAENSVALLTNGGVMSWGANSGGQLGIGGQGEAGRPTEQLAFSDLPVQVCAVGVGAVNLCRSGPFLSGASAISAGSHHEMALLNAGAVSWGDECNYSGGEVCTTLGSAFAFIPRAVPVEGTGGLGVAKLVSAGDRYSLAFGPPLPTLARISPTVGLDKGGEAIAITGTELSGATAVHFGSVSAPSFTVDSDTSITAVSPAEPNSVVPVTVTTPAGTSPVANGIFFHYMEPFPQPIIKAVKPKTGPAAGGTAVLITGSGFFGAGIAVKFGSTSAASVVVNENPVQPQLNSITAVSPPGTTGTVELTVTTLGGTSPFASAGHFKFEHPTVTTLSPNTGPRAGGTSVTVTGSGFALGTTGTTFKFGTLPSSSVDCTSTTSCTVVSPARKSAGTVDVKATVGKPSSPKNSPGDQFTYS
jgi:alpha-tubulin suppressor-like RCC1 family protein